MEEIKKKQAISLPEVKEILQKVDPEKLDQIQRWTYDYVTKFTKTDASNAKKAKQKLVKECELTEEQAVELINISPRSLAEIRTFTFGWKKLILEENQGKILNIIKEIS